MSDAEKTALLNFVRVGGGFLGVHSATDTFYTWPDCLDLIGGYFNGHPWQSGEVAATTGDFVVETGNNHASVGARATIILIGISHAATVALTFVNAAKFDWVSLTCGSTGQDGVGRSRGPALPSEKITR